jgi:hypothetical protein
MRLLALGGQHLAVFVWPRKKMELLIGVVVGFLLGFGVREAMSRYR